MGFNTENLGVDLGGTAILREVGFSLPECGLTGIIGPNGCGKTTLLRALGGLVAPAVGRVCHHGQDLAAQPPRARARQIAMLPQSGLAPPAITVRALVARGRTPWLRPFLPMGAADHRAVARALDLTGLTDLAERPVAALSGGQRQRVWIALVLAQESRTILLDEPLNHLDLPYQAELIALLRQLKRDHLIVMILHDLTIAARLCDRVLALREGRLVAAGPVPEVLCAPVLRDCFGIGFEIDMRAGPEKAVVLPEGF